MAFAATQRRPIEGAVATVGVSDRVQFLRKTYGLLGISLIAFAAITGGMMRFATETSLSFSMWAMHGQLTWLLVLGLFMVVGIVAQKLAMSPSSRGLQMLGLGIAVVAQAVLLQPLLWIVMIRFGNSLEIAHGMRGTGAIAVGMTGTAANLIIEAVVITLAIFVGLTLTVFITKKDFSFLRGILMIASFAMLGIILVSMLFGFHLGLLFLGFGIVVLGGYILMQTSMVMSQFPPTAYVAAALMLFSTVATLFWYVLQLLMELNSNRR
jgi:FtsH-binding integral membrane protein